MKTNLILFSAIFAFAFTGCSKDDNKGGGNITNPYEFAIKTGKVTYTYTYEDEPAETWILIFDDYGKKMRWEIPGDGVAHIYDNDTEKGYTLFTDDKTYMEINAGAIGGLMFFTYFGDDAKSGWAGYAGYAKKADKTLAGKKCSVYSWKEGAESMEWGGWNRITFWVYDTEDGDLNFKMEATAFTESIPAGSFTLPSDYTKMGQ